MEPVEVRDADLVVTSLPAGPFGRVWLVRRTSAVPGRRTPDRGDAHEVGLAGGVWRCDCKGFKFKRRCRHCDAVKSLLEGIGS
jgi:hypothetical protein